MSDRNEGLIPYIEYDPDDGECWNCGGEGYVYGCSWDWQCDTYDVGEGTCLCARRCSVCRPASGTPTHRAETLGSVGEADGGPTSEAGDAQ